MRRQLGPYYPAPDKWKEDVLDEMDRRGLTRRELAASVDCDPSMVTKLLRLSTDKEPGPKTSRIAKRIADHLGIPLPATKHEDYDEVLVDLERLKRRNPDAHRAAIELLRAIIAGSLSPGDKAISRDGSNVLPSTATSRSKRR